MRMLFRRITQRDRGATSGLIFRSYAAVHPFCLQPQTGLHPHPQLVPVHRFVADTRWGIS